MSITRRDMLAGVAGAVALGATTAAQTADPTKVRGTPSRAVGQRAASEKV